MIFYVVHCFHVILYINIDFNIFPHIRLLVMTKLSSCYLYQGKLILSLLGIIIVCMHNGCLELVLTARLLNKFSWLIVMLLINANT